MERGDRKEEEATRGVTEGKEALSDKAGREMMRATREVESKGKAVVGPGLTLVKAGAGRRPRPS